MTRPLTDEIPYSVLQPLSVWPFAVPATHASGLGNWPKISIVTPNFNYGSSLNATMASVLNQDYPNLEYIIIDGGSRDESCEVIRQYASKLSYWVSESDSGQYAAINKGFQHSTGEIMGWINSDDIMMPWTLSTVANIFMQFPEIQWITGLPTVIQNHVIHSVGSLQPRPQELLRLGFFVGGDVGIVQQESTFWRRGLWEMAGGLREDLTLAADFELWTRFAEHSQLAAVSTILGGFSVTDSNRSTGAGETIYRKQCESVVNQWDECRRLERSKWFARWTMYCRVRGYNGLKGFVRRFSGLHQLSGPVIHWSFREKRFGVEVQRFVN